MPDLAHPTNVATQRDTHWQEGGQSHRADAARSCSRQSQNLVVRARAWTGDRAPATAGPARPQPPAAGRHPAGCKGKARDGERREGIRPGGWCLGSGVDGRQVGGETPGLWPAVIASRNSCSPTLAEMLCREERIYSRQSSPIYLAAGPSLDRARYAVATGMKQRFQGFVDNFDGAIRHTCPNVAEPQAVLRGLIAYSDEELLQGVENDALTRNLQASGVQPPNPHALIDIMETLAQAQNIMGIRPPVLAYNKHAHKVYLIGRSLLFFRRYRSPRWP